MSAVEDSEVSSCVGGALSRLGLNPTGELIHLEALAGGVSSDVWKIDGWGVRPLVAKRALATLRVADEWHAPVERSVAEYDWLRLAASVDQRRVPRVYGRDRDSGVIIMEFFPPREYPTWKSQLLAGHIDSRPARDLGQFLARMHRATANDAHLAMRFSNHDIFERTRVEPYLVTAARRNPGLSDCLMTLAQTLARARRAVIHGDPSPKNVLVSARGLILIDAECACYSDPAFDVAFTACHLLTKVLVTVHHQWRGLKSCLTAFVKAYMSQVDWEAPAQLERRAAALLPALVLARIDGKCPVEYASEKHGPGIRAWAATELANSPTELAMVGERWHAAAATWEFGAIGEAANDDH